MILMPSGFILKFWFYFCKYSADGFKNIDGHKKLSASNPNIDFILTLMSWISILFLIFFPFGYLLRLEVYYLTRRDRVGRSPKTAHQRKKAHQDERKNSFDSFLIF